METTTIACPPGFTDSAVDDATAPIWVDASGVEYKIASGLLEGYTTTVPLPAQPDRVNVIVGMDGLAALAEMGLTAAPADLVMSNK
jgi:hypothetical protein